MFDFANPVGGYTVTINVTDGEFSDQATMTVTVDNTVNEAPDLAANHANVSENAMLNSVVYTVLYFYYTVYLTFQKLLVYSFLKDIVNP